MTYEAADTISSTKSPILPCHFPKKKFHKFPFIFWNPNHHAWMKRTQDKTWIIIFKDKNQSFRKHQTKSCMHRSLLKSRKVLEYYLYSLGNWIRKHVEHSLTQINIKIYSTNKIKPLSKIFFFSFLHEVVLSGRDKEVKRTFLLENLDKGLC